MKRIPGNTLQKYILPAQPEVIADIQYLIEAECDSFKILFIAQITTCVNGNLDIYIANPCKKEEEIILTLTATPVITVEEAKNLK